MASTFSDVMSKYEQQLRQVDQEGWIGIQRQLQQNFAVVHYSSDTTGQGAGWDWCHGTCWQAQNQKEIGFVEVEALEHPQKVNRQVRVSWEWCWSG